MSDKMRQRKRTSSERQRKRFREALLATLSGLLLGMVHACPGNLPFYLQEENLEVWSTVLEVGNTSFTYTETVHFAWDDARSSCKDQGGDMFVPKEPARTYGSSVEHKLASKLREFALARTSAAPWAGVKLDNKTWLDVLGNPIEDKLWAMTPIKANDSRFFDPNNRCAFFFVFREERFSPAGPGELFGLLDGSCNSQRSALCVFNGTS